MNSPHHTPKSWTLDTFWYFSADIIITFSPTVTTLAVVWTSATRDKYFNLEESNAIEYDQTFHTTKSRRQEIMLDECIELYCKEEVRTLEGGE